MTDDARPIDKAAWRRHAAALRPAGPPDHAAVVAGLRRFLASVGPARPAGSAGPAAGWVLTYRPMPGEVDLDALLVDLRCAVTRTERGHLLSVHPADAPTERHRLGYLQPVAAAALVPLDGIVAALVPGVLFDAWGGRLGHGAGHYDRLLPLLPAGIPLVGVTVDALVVAERLPCEAHDVPMTHLATESGVRPARS